MCLSGLGEILVFIREAHLQFNSFIEVQKMLQLQHSKATSFVATDALHHTFELITSYRLYMYNKPMCLFVS